MLTQGSEGRQSGLKAHLQPSSGKNTDQPNVQELRPQDKLSSPNTLLCGDFQI